MAKRRAFDSKSEFTCSAAQEDLDRWSLTIWRTSPKLVPYSKSPTYFITGDDAVKHGEEKCAELNKLWEENPWPKP